MNYFTVDKILRELQGKMLEDGTHKYERLLPHAYDFLDQFKTEMSREVKTVKLKVSNQRTAKLPVDYIEFTKIGVVVGEAVRVLAYNSELSNIPDCPTPSYGIYHHVSKDEPHYPFFGYRDELIGYGQGGFRDAFSIDRSARVIRFGSEVNAGDVYLEYQSSEIDSCAETPVHPWAKKSLEYYVLWQYFMHRQNPIFQTYERQYWNEYRKLGAKLDTWTIADLYAAMYDNYSLMPKH